MIKVYTLGKFQIFTDERAISLGRRMSNVLRLFLLLACNREKGLTKGELMYQLFYSQENDSDQSGNLRVTMFRLRKALERVGVSCPDGSDYILIKRGLYSWNPEIPLWSDIHAFETAAATFLAGNSHSPNQGKKALALYTGEYLPPLSTEAWVITRQLKLSRTYDAVYHCISNELMCQKEYQQCYELAHQAAALFPFDEYQADEIDCLLSMNAFEKAFRLYTDTTELYYRELGLEPSAQMRSLLTRMEESLNYSSTAVKQIQAILRDPDPRGSYYCSFPSFMDNYRFVSRFLNRTDQSAYVVVAILEDGNHVPLPPGGDKTLSSSKLLRDTIQCVLRKGDIFTAYNGFAFLILLMCSDADGCQVATDRIRKRFTEHTPAKKKVHLSFQIFPVSETREPASYFNKV